MKYIIIYFLTLLYISPVIAQNCHGVEEIVRNRHEVNEFTKNHPYTLFDRHNGSTFQVTINKIRERIFLEKDTGDVYFAYQELYNWAIQNRPSDGGLFVKNESGNPNGISALSWWAKYNAFIFLIGLDGDGNFMDTTSYNGVISFAKRDAFRDKVYSFTNGDNAFTYLNDKMPRDKSYLQHSTRSLIFWLEAYDLLKAAHDIDSLAAQGRALWGSKDEDRNSGDCSPRNKLRKLMRDLYERCDGLDGVITHSTGWRKNHGIAAASCLIMGAQVLHSAATETNILKGNFISNILGGTGFKPQWSPIKWHRLGVNGLELDLFATGPLRRIENIDRVKMAVKKDSFASYAEGPSYASYGLLDCGIPAFIAYQNFYPKWSNEPFLKRNEIKSILNWYNYLTVNDNTDQRPTYDNSAELSSSILAISGIPEYYHGKYEGLEYGRLADYVAMIGGNEIFKIQNSLPEEILMSDAGNWVVRKNWDSSTHYFLALFENKPGAIDRPQNYKDNTHEDDDLGSFSIFAGYPNGEELFQLVIDPVYLMYGNEQYTNSYYHHNVPIIDDGKVEGKSQIYRFSRQDKPQNFLNNQVKSFSICIDFDQDFGFLGESFTNTGLIKRGFNTFHIENNSYYIIEDKFDATEVIGDFQNVKIQINGNGRSESQTYEKVGNLCRWKNPCTINPSLGWNLTAHFAGLKGGRAGTYTSEVPFSSLEINGTKTGGAIISGDCITRMKFYQPIRKTIFQTFLYPQKCTDVLPTVIKRDTFENKLITEIDFVFGVDTSLEARLQKSNSTFVNDTVSHIHLVKWEGGTDSLSNPFNRAYETNQFLYFNANKLFMENHTLSYMGAGFRYCPSSYIGIRKFISNEGSYLVFKDTLFYSTIFLDFDFLITGKERYSCQISTKETVNASDTIKIKLPEVSRGVDMIALIASTKDTLHGRYDSLSNYIYLGLKEGNYAIEIKRKDPCLDCYFPPIGTDFDTLFLANDGLPHTLGNSKEITDNHGNLSILNGTEVNMCAGVILHNKDSLILEGPAQTKAIAVSSCAGIDSLAKNSDNSMLIISSGAALVLDAGSQTYIKNGASLFVKQNGSLVIKSGATLEIGDSGRAGWGELIAEPGAFIYIEDGAEIRYRRVIGSDTADINTINFAIGNGGVIAGIHWYIDSVLKAESILPSVTSPIAICSLDSINPIGNPYWGFTNFGRPKATFKTKSLTLCAGDPFHIELKRLLNDAQMRITVCRVDSVWRFDGNGNGFWKDTCVNDSIVMDSLPPDPNCLKPRVAPEDWLWYFPVNTTHRVHITVKNECGWAHDTLVEVVVKDTPQISLNVNTTACEGYGTLKAAARVNRTGPVHYAFEITELPDTLNPIYSQANPTEEYSFDTLATVPDTFDFPGFYFKGGRKYIVSFTLLDECGNTTLEQEVSVPTGAYIQLERPTVYANPVHGARQLQLHGYVNSADSFSWSPTTWLNRTDSLVVISTPGDSIQYVLTAYKNNCIAYDTATIKYNRVANAGVEDTVCYTSSKVVLGNGYDLSLLLGYLYYKGGSDFRTNWFFSRTSANPEYFKYLSMFMQTTTFKGWAMGAGNLYLHFTEELYREETMKQPWFANYFEQLTAFTDPNMYALDSFVTNLGGNSNLTDNYNSVGDYVNISSGFTDFFSYYDDFVSNYLNTISMSWHKIAGNDTLFNGSLQESAIAVDEPTKTTIYLQQVITPEYAEIDEVTIYVDTIPVVAFAPQMQVDSTVLFENFTAPTDGATHYSWNFGDGSPLSTDVHPLHTFPAFDTSFVVCLTAINDCGNYTWCDTVYIDSAHWGGSMRLWSEERERVTEGERVLAEGIEALLYPNPTEGNSTLAYTINEDATLYITDAMGKLIWQNALSPARTQKPAASRLLQIPSQTFTNGIYFYTIQTTNGTARGKFVVRK